MKIVTSFVDPPIPDRRFDYCAYDEDRYDGATDSHQPPIGWGRTRAEALADLRGIYEDELDVGESLDPALQAALTPQNELFDTIVDICRPVDPFADDKTEEEERYPEPSSQTGFV